MSVSPATSQYNTYHNILTRYIMHHDTVVNNKKKLISMLPATSIRNNIA